MRGVGSYKDFRALLHLPHKETYLRLFIGELLPSQVERCIFLGLDMLVTDDLCKINEVDLKGNIIAAALDISASRKDLQEDRRSRLGLRHPEKYFNGDLLVVDLKVWRENDLGRKLQTYARENYDYTFAADQDALNPLLQGKWLELEQRWNLSQYAREITLEHKGIIHLIGPSKPWHADYNYKFKQHFLDVLDRTAFRGMRPAKIFGLAILLCKLHHIMPTPEILRRKIRKAFKKIYGTFKHG